jgi:hypothetical protein
MKKLFILFLFTILQISVYAQPSIQWQKCLGGTLNETARSIKQTMDGGYILTGSTISNDFDISGNHGGGDVWVVKLDNLGNIQWQKCLGGTASEFAWSIQQTTDGDFILTGYTSSNDGDVSGNHGGTHDVWVVKLDSSGNLQWQKCLGGTATDYAFSIQQTMDSGYILTGFTASNDGDVIGNHGGGSDVWVVKLDSLGSIQWQKCLGGTSFDEGWYIQQTANGSYILIGLTSSIDGDVISNHGSFPFFDVWVVKLDNMGNLQWQKCLGGTSDEFAWSIQQTTDGGYIFIGITRSNDGDVSGNHGGGDVWVVKLDSLGNIQWQKCLGGTASEIAYSIKHTTDGGYVLTGFTQSNDGDVSGNNGSSDVWVVKLDSLGNIQWQKCLGGAADEGANYIHQTIDGGYILTGVTYSNDVDVSGNHGGGDVWLVKLSSTVGMNELSAITSLNVYPNPASDNFTVNLSLSKTENLTLQIKDILGQNIIEPIYLKNISGDFSHTFSTSELPGGIYLLDIIGDEGRRTEKVIIEHE